MPNHNLQLPGNNPTANKVGLEALTFMLGPSAPPDSRLFTSASDMPRVQSEELGAYSLASPDYLVADWREPYRLARQTLRTVATTTVARIRSDPESMHARAVPLLQIGHYGLGDGLTAQEVVDIVPRVASLVTVLDDLALVAPTLSKRDFAALVKSLVGRKLLSSDAGAGIKEEMRGKGVKNKLRIDSSDSSQEAPRQFAQLAQKCMQDDVVRSYTVSMLGGPKAFLKGDPEKPGEVIMVRRMELESFVGWLAAYEAADIWRRQGFKYIPIEPILDFVIDERTLYVDVRTMLLRPVKNAVAVEAGMSDLERRQLHDQLGRIAAGLDDACVAHGHLHQDNLPVVSAYDTRPYAIDFDNSYMGKQFQDAS